MKKRYVFILLAAVLLCGTVFPSAALTYTVGIGVSAPDTAVPGETVVYVISVDPAQASGGIVTLNFNLSYDETYLTFQSVTSSAPDGWSFYSNCKNGVVYLMSEAPYGASGYHTPVTAAGQLLYTVTFTANSVQGSTQIATKGNVSGTETDGLGLVYGNPVSATLQISASHAVSFDANGGSGAPDDVNKLQGSALTLPQTVPTRAGYDFAGWATAADAVLAEYAAGGILTDDTVTALYAVWTPHSLVWTDGTLSAHNGLLLGVTAETAPSQLSSRFADSSLIGYMDADGQAVAADTDSYVGTGWQIRLIDADGNVLDSLTVAVMGDINGTGTLDSNDCTMVRTAYFDDSVLTTDAQRAAADLNGNGTVESNDYILLRMSILALR